MKDTNKERRQFFRLINRYPVLFNLENIELNLATRYETMLFSIISEIMSEIYMREIEMSINKKYLKYKLIASLGMYYLILFFKTNKLNKLKIELDNLNKTKHLLDRIIEKSISSLDNALEIKHKDFVEKRLHKR